MGQEDAGVVVVGSINADIVLDVERLPKPGETINARTPNSGRVLPGGKGANQAVAAALLGATTDFVGRFGSDAHVVQLQRALTQAGVRFAHSQRVDSGPSGQAYIFVEPTGQSSIVIVPGANFQWPDPDAVLTPDVQELVKQAKVLLLQREIPDAINVAFATLARKHGTLVFLDMGGFDTLLNPILYSNVDYLCPNETELSRLCLGKSITTRKEAIAAATALLQEHSGLNHILVTLGSLGSVVISNSVDGGLEVYEEPIYPLDSTTTTVVDTTGAGDCFRAAFAVMVSRGNTIAEALKFASAASAVCIQRQGAIPSMPSMDEVLALVDPEV